MAAIRPSGIPDMPYGPTLPAWSDYARRYRRGQRIAIAVVESRVNQGVIERRTAKKPPMRWSRRGANLLVQLRVAVLDGRLPQIFQRWYPRFRPPDPAAA
jgi:hypothetical protein